MFIITNIGLKEGLFIKHNHFSRLFICIDYHNLIRDIKCRQMEFQCFKSSNISIRRKILLTVLFDHIPVEPIDKPLLSITIVRHFNKIDIFFEINEVSSVFKVVEEFIHFFIMICITHNWRKQDSNFINSNDLILIFDKTFNNGIKKLIFHRQEHTNKNDIKYIMIFTNKSNRFFHKNYGVFSVAFITQKNTSNATIFLFCVKWWLRRSYTHRQISQDMCNLEQFKLHLRR